MAHYAFITDRVVTEVIVGKDEGTDGSEKYIEITAGTGIVSFS